MTPCEHDRSERFFGRCLRCMPLMKADGTLHPAMDRVRPTPQPFTPSHGITDPNAPDGWKCGDPACQWHGVRADSPSPEGAEPPVECAFCGHENCGCAVEHRWRTYACQCGHLRPDWREAALPEPSLDVERLNLAAYRTPEKRGESRKEWLVRIAAEYARLASEKGTDRGS